MSAPAPVPDVDGVLARASFADDGLLPAVIQQHDTREVLMLGYMDREALRRPGRPTRAGSCPGDPP